MAKSWKQQFKSALYGMLLGALIPTLAFGQATLLPDAKQQYLNDAAQPVASGHVDYFIPNTTTRKTVWSDAAKTTPLPNPVLLDAAGRPQPTGQTYGDGSYRQRVVDQDGLTVWDAVTTSTGSGSSSPTTTWNGGVMVGTVIMWHNSVLPPKYLYAAGQAVSRTTYSDLYTAITLPINILCSSGIATVTVSTDVSDRTPIGAPIEASCFPPGATVVAKTGGQLTMSVNATVTLSVSATLFPWGNGDGATTFNVPDYRGFVPMGRNNMLSSISPRVTSAYYGTDPNAVNARGGSEAKSLTVPQIPNLTSSANNNITVNLGGYVSITSNLQATVPVSSSGSLYTVYAPAGVGDWLLNKSSFTTSNSIAVNSVGTGGVTGAAHSVIQPTATSDFIVKALPDDLPSGPGVTSVQGMTGALACGTGMVCTADTISTSVTGINVLAPSALATAAVLPNTPTYNNGASGVGATLTASTNTTLTVDGTAAPLNTVVLVKNQASSFQNGIYTVTTAGSGATPWVLTRATYFDQAAEMKTGSYTYITGGVANSGSSWTLQNAVVTVGTDPAVFTLFNIVPATGVSSIAGNTGAFTLQQPLTNAGNVLTLNAPITPQARITLASGLAIMTSSQASASTVYVTPYGGCLIPIYDGTNFVPTCFAEVSQATTDTTKSPAAVGANLIYDIFCWIDTGPTNRCTRAPPWTNDTTRSAGTALTLLNGIWLNTNAITNGPAALRGTYIGSVRSDGASLINYTFGAFGAGCTGANFSVFNAYNRVPVATSMGITAANWTWNTNAWRAINGSTSCVVLQLRGLNEDPVHAQYNALGVPGAATSMAAGVGVDSTTAFSGTTAFIGSGETIAKNAVATYVGFPGLGFHNYQPIEFNSTATASTWVGTAGTAYTQTGFHVELWQ